MIKISVAGLTIALNNRFSEIEDFATDYLTCDEPLFEVSATDEELNAELALGMGVSPGTCEGVVLYRKIAERLSDYDAFVFHSSVIVKGGMAYAITARSGVGKTTHTRLWLEEFGSEAYVLNGDKPIIRLINGVPYAAGTPWMGKERYGRPGLVRLGGIGFLKRSEKNYAQPLAVSEALDDFLAQIYIPKSQGTLKTLLLADKLLSSVPLTRLCVNMEKDAPLVAAAALEAQIVNN